jgi:hypothetical protein
MLKNLRPMAIMAMSRHGFFIAKGVDTIIAPTALRFSVRRKTQLKLDTAHASFALVSIYLIGNVHI